MSERLRFGIFEVRVDRRQLLIAGTPVSIGARAFDVLMALIERRDRVVSKNELLDLVWPGVVVEENNLQVQVSALRKLLGPQTIATIPGRGYRFTAAIDSESAPSALPASVPSPAPAGNLPVALPALFGRHDDASALMAMVPAYRAVTIVGAGGIGKTRLAQAVARTLQKAFADGVWWVEPAPVADASLLPAAVAQALGIALPGRRAASPELIDALRGRALLLLLDNCEHLIDAVSSLVEAIQTSAAHVHVLATSQELLKTQGEELYRLGPLALPATNDLDAAGMSGAVALFVARVRAQQPAFALDAGNVAEVVDVCRRLDGLPLAIELAAARVPLRGVSGVRERLHERFRVLTGGARAAPRRQQTLRETLDWSHGLLGERERAVFRRAGAFAGTFGLPAAQQALADANLDE